MKPLIFEVTTIGQASLCIMPAPSGRHLSRDLAFYRMLGVDKIVSLLEDKEAKKLGVHKEQALCEKLGLQFEQFAIPDQHTPDITTFQPFIETLYQELESGDIKTLAVHCRAGIGRTGVVAGCLLRRDGHRSDHAVKMMSDVRGYAMPQTEEQYHFIVNYPVSIKPCNMPTPAAQSRL